MRLTLFTRVSLSLRFTRCAALLGIVLAAALGTAAQPGAAKTNQADQSLRSNGRVNPSTLGLEFSLPLASYAGRGGALPLGLNYSSKVWKMNFMSREAMNTTGCISYYEAEFADGTAGGWTSSSGTAFIEYTGDDPAYSIQGYPDNDDCTGSPPPTAYIYKIQRLQLHLPSGESHELRKQDAPVTLDDAGACGTNNWSGWYFASDGSNLKYYENCATGTYYALLPDGTRYDFAASVTAETIGVSGNFARTMRIAHRMLDRHGNQTVYNAPNASHPNGSWTDTLGRVLDVPLGRRAPTAPGTQDYTAPGLGGGTLLYQFVWKNLQGATAADSALTDFNQTLKCRGASPNLPAPSGSGTPLFTGYNFNYVICPNAEQLFNPVLLAAVVLPNGAQYRFSYNLYGEIDHIEYPTGGVETLAHQQVLPLTMNVSVSYPERYPTAKVNRGVVNRQVYESATATIPQEWTYQTAYAGGGYRVTQTNPDATRQERFLYQGNGSCAGCGGTFGFENALAGMPYEERSFASDNQLKSQSFKYWTKTVIDEGYGARDWHPRQFAEKSIVYEGGGSGLAATSYSEFDGDLSVRETPLLVKMTIAYHYEIVANPGVPDANAGPPTYAAPSSAVAQRAETTFLINDANVASTTRQAYLDRNLVGLATASVIRDAANNINNIKARSEISYDEGTYLEAATITNAAGWTNPNTGYRGLPTTMKVWNDTNSSWITTHQSFDQFGNARKSWDGRGNLSEIQYTDNYSDNTNHNAYALPTKTITPIPGGNGSTTAFETSVKYDFNTGLPVSSVDANNLETRMEYNDPLNRPTRVQQYFGGLPIGAATETVYGAGTSESTRYVKTRAQIDADHWKEGYSWYDGLGRGYKSQAVDAGSGDVFTLTCYDTVGRVEKTSNPFRNVSGATCDSTNLEWTSVSYDATGRAWKTTTPDGAMVQTAWAIAATGDTIGTAVTVTDQANKQRRSITNALGQLKRVDEPLEVGGLGALNQPNQPTYYAYDALNNLMTVKQGGTLANPEQTRTFAYDSLSRLKSATNPESGLIQYQYDNNGNLTKKTDARLVETTYAYDALNRVTQRSYGGEPSGQTATPPVNCFYDNVTNAKGKLTKVSSTTSTTEYTAFDVLGRVTAHQQTTDGTAYTTDYAYNLSGAMIEETYPSTRVVKNVLDAEGDLALVQSKKNGNSGYWNYAKAFNYTAAGAVSSMQLGNGRWESTAFNSRLQPTQIALGGTQNATNLLKLNFDYGTTNNNGNVLSQQIAVPSETRNNTTYVAFTATQNYSYDSLNRLKSAEETIPNQVGWKQTFIYDRYGNRRFDTANNNTTTLPLNCATAVCNPTVDPATNKLVGYVFDNAGNTKTDANGRQFLYDGEGKQIIVKEANNTPVGEYYYDGDGKRVKKIGYSNGQATETTIFVYDAGGKLVAEYANQIASATTAQVSYLTSDHLGSPRINTDANGQVISRHDYQPFGEEVARTSYGSDATRQKFTGYEKDIETDLDFAQARMYSNRLGRFTSVDPENYQAMSDISDPQSWNAYAYVNNNPLGRVDPSGMGFWDKVKNAFLWGMFAEDEDVQKEEDKTRQDLLNSAAELGNDDGSLIVQNYGGEWVRFTPDQINNLSRKQLWTLANLAYAPGNKKQTISSDQMTDVVDFTAGVIQQSSPAGTRSPKNSGGWKPPQEHADDVIKETINKAKNANQGLESGRHGRWMNQAGEELKRMAKEAQKKGDLPEYWKKLETKGKELVNQANQTGHKGGVRP